MYSNKTKKQFILWLNWSQLSTEVNRLLSSFWKLWLETNTLNISSMRKTNQNIKICSNPIIRFRRQKMVWTFILNFLCLVSHVDSCRRFTGVSKQEAGDGFYCLLGHIKQRTLLAPQRQTENKLSNIKLLQVKKQEKQKQYTVTLDKIIFPRAFNHISLSCSRGRLFRSSPSIKLVCMSGAHMRGTRHRLCFRWLLLFGCESPAWSFSDFSLVSYRGSSLFYWCYTSLVDTKS